MEPWVFEDGTRVWLGGRVEGDSGLAKSIRVSFRLLTEGTPIGSGWGRYPSQDILDVRVPHLLDCWLRDKRRVIVSAPEVEYPEMAPQARFRTGVVY